LNTFTLRYL